jgi:hypothetical protein
MDRADARGGRGHCRKYGDSLKRPLQELSLGWTNFTWIYKVLVSQMAVVKHFLEQPCTRGSDNFFTSAPHGTVPRRYRRVLGIGLHDRAAEHAAHERAYHAAHASNAPWIPRGRGAYRAHGPATDHAVAASGQNSCVADASSERSLGAREAKRSTAPALWTMPSTDTNIASRLSALVATAGHAEPTLHLHRGMLRARA